MKSILKAIGFGFLVWLVPFLSSFFFFDMESGQMIIGDFFFKTIMILISMALGMFLMAKYFMQVKKDYLFEGLYLALIWLGINWILDLIILIPMSGMSISSYFTDIGLRYLNILFLGVGIGYLLDKK